MRSRLVLLVASLLVAHTGLANGQGLDIEAPNPTIGRLIGAGVVLSASDFIGGGTLDFEDGSGSVRVRHLPWHHRFGEPDRRIRPWVLGEVGRIVDKESLQITEVPDDGRFEVTSVAAGGGARIGIGSGFYAEPSAALIYSWVDTALRYNSPESEALRPILDGVIFNWEAEALTLLGAARLGWERRWSNEVALDVAGQVVALRTDPVSTDSPFQDATTDSNYSRLQARLRIPLGATVRDADLYLIPRVVRTFFSEEIAEPLVSGDMTQLNLRLLAEIADPSPEAAWWQRLRPRAVGLSAGYTTAHSLSGWSFGVTFHSWDAGW